MATKSDILGTSSNYFTINDLTIIVGNIDPTNDIGINGDIYLQKSGKIWVKKNGLWNDSGELVYLLGFFDNQHIPAGISGEKYYNTDTKLIYTYSTQWGNPESPIIGKLYVNLDDSILYRWAGDVLGMVVVSPFPGIATTTTPGIVQIGTGINVDANGIISVSVPITTFTSAGVTATTGTTLELGLDIQSKLLPVGTTLYGEVTLTDMPAGIGNAEMKAIIAERTGDLSVINFTLTSTNVAPYEWTYNWWESNSTVYWSPRLTDQDVLTKTNITAYTPTTDYNPATKKYVDEHSGGNYTAGNNIEINNTTISAKGDDLSQPIAQAYILPGQGDLYTLNNLTTSPTVPSITWNDINPSNCYMENGARSNCNIFIIDGKLYVENTQLGTDNNWVKCCGYYFTSYNYTAYAIKGDGTLWSIKYINSVKTLTQVGTETTWTDISGRRYYYRNTDYKNAIGISNKKLYSLVSESSAALIDDTKEWIGVIGESSGAAYEWAVAWATDGTYIVKNNAITNISTETNWSSIVYPDNTGGGSRLNAITNGKLYQILYDGTISQTSTATNWVKVAGVAQSYYYDLGIMINSDGDLYYQRQTSDPVLIDNTRNWTDIGFYEDNFYGLGIADNHLYRIYAMGGPTPSTSITAIDEVNNYAKVFVNASYYLAIKGDITNKKYTVYNPIVGENLYDNLEASSSNTITTIVGETLVSNGITYLRSSDLDSIFTTIPLDYKNKLTNSYTLFSISSEKQNKIVSSIYTLIAANWDSTTKQYTLTINGLTTNTVVWVSPEVSTIGTNESDYIAANVRGLSTSTNTLILLCDTIPTNNINIVVGL